ncbi:hypothetical protein ASG04_14270 [Curtobacterium sp. Leaf183]|uniref:hypothetical protein n=1 Tax=Curtobacterium sp. Leaf183 TaxID=1736291 RepID=UPI0006FCCAAC|nr:hypothetical protein [Curtobacterium sp. Leaf183]KQS08270.1 hypothetical protein ASG04_14270 [Curtobacterium sp. Leaf183]
MLRTLIAGTVTLVLGLAILVTTVIDDVAPRGATDIVTVWDSDASSSGSFQHLVERTARSHDMTVMKELRHEAGSGVARAEYVANAGAARSFESVHRDLTGFDPSLTTTFHPISDLPDNRINGMYLTDAGDSSARAFAASLADHGVAVTVNALSPLFVSLWVVSEIPAIPLSGCLVIAVVLGTTAWQSGRRRRVAIAASHGRSAVRSAWFDAGGLAARTTAWGAVGIIAVTVVLVVVNGGTRIGTFLLIAIAGLVLATTAMGATTMVAAALPRSSMLASINGARPWRTVLTIALVGNLGALALGSGAAATAWTDVTLARADAVERTLWRGSLGDVRMGFESSIAELDEAEDGLAGVYERMDAAGTAILADHTVQPDDSQHTPDGGNVLIVNAQYLRAQSIQTLSGARVLPEDVSDTALTLLVPEGVVLPESDVQVWRDYMALQRELSAEPRRIPTQVPVQVMPMRDAPVFTYATDDLAGTSTMTGGVVAVLPSAFPSASGDLVTAAMTSGEVVFTDPSALRADLAAHGLSDVVATIAPLGDFVSYRSVVIERGLRHALLALGVVVLVLVLSAVLASQAIAAIARRRTGIALLHGRRRLVTLSSVVAGPTAMIVGATTVLASTGITPADAPSIACAALDVLVVAILTAFHLRTKELP